jgi:pyridoxamine 5'-phosphate oxidase
MNRDLHSIRRDYQFDDLLEEQSGNDPLALFDTWLEKAIEVCPDDPTAMVFSSVDADGWPHSCGFIKAKKRIRLFFFH